MEKLILILFLCSSSTCISQTVMLKVAGTNKHYAFYEDESLIKNSNGAVLQGTLAVDQIFSPQGTSLSLAFKQGESIKFNEKGNVISGTLLIDYTLKTESGIKTFYSGDKITFKSNGQILLPANPSIQTNKSICLQSYKSYINIPAYCDSIQFYDVGKQIITSLVIAKNNFSISGCDFNLVKLKKNTSVNFYVSNDRFRFISNENDNPEYREELNKLDQCMEGTIESFTIDGTYKFFVWGHGPIDFPDGTEITFQAHVIKPGFFYKGYNWVKFARLGKDTFIQGYGLVKKGKIIVGEHSLKAELQPSQGSLSITDSY